MDVVAVLGLLAALATALAAGHLGLAPLRAGAGVLMSQANRCDRCGGLYEVKKGALAIDVHIATGKDDRWDGWSEVDFCPDCSAVMLKAIGPAIDRGPAQKKKGT